MNRDKWLLVIAGPTASGKTALAVKLARKLNTVVLSADSRQFFSEMRIGTARPSENELEGIPHYFLGSHSVNEEYNIGKFESEALQLLEKIFEEKDIVILVGGSGLYIKMLCEGLDKMPDGDPEIREELKHELNEKGLESLTKELEQSDPVYYNQVDLSNPQRVIRALEVYRSTGIPFSAFRKGEKKERQFKTIKIGLMWDRETLYERINRRVDQMVEEGLFEEAESLYPLKNLNALQTVGYQEIFDYLDGKSGKEEAIELIKRNTRRFAKRQMTWFRRDREIEWFGIDREREILEFITSKLKKE